MNLINRLHLFAAASRDIALGRSRSLQVATDEMDKFITQGNIACKFNLTDAFIAVPENAVTYSYPAGDGCPFAITTVSYTIDPLSSTGIYSGENSNTFELKGSSNLAVMMTNQPEKVYCYENSITVTNSTQYQDGSATFEISGGVIAISPQNIGEWTTISVNGGSNMNIPGLYYIEDGLVAGEVIFKDDEKLQTEANYTNVQGTIIDLCEASNPKVSSAAAKNALHVVSTLVPASIFFFLL